MPVTGGISMEVGESGLLNGNHLLVARAARQPHELPIKFTPKFVKSTLPDSPNSTSGRPLSRSIDHK